MTTDIRDLLPPRLRWELGRLKAGIWQIRQHHVMKGLRGVIHVGANTGQERAKYDAYDLNVLWIEPAPDTFALLQKAIAGYEKQRAFNYLVLDEDGKSAKLNVASNGGASSSVLTPALHHDIWPQIEFSRAIELIGYTLDTIIDREGINLSLFDAAVLDTQGSELMILHGAHRVLEHIRYIQVEVADFEAYVGCPRPRDFSEFLAPFGFREWRRIPQASHPQGGRYHEIIYRKR